MRWNHTIVSWRTFFYIKSVVDFSLWWWGLTVVSHMLSLGSTIESHSQHISCGTDVLAPPWAMPGKIYWSFTYCKWSQHDLFFFLVERRLLAHSERLIHLMVSACKQVSFEILLPWNCYSMPKVLWCFSVWRYSSGCTTTMMRGLSIALTMRSNGNRCCASLHCTWARD